MMLGHSGILLRPALECDGFYYAQCAHVNTVCMYTWSCSIDKLNCAYVGNCSKIGQFLGLEDSYTATSVVGGT